MKSIWIAVILQVIAVLVLGTLAILKTRTVSETVLSVRETFGYPGESYQVPNFSLQIPEADMMIFVCMTTVPSRFHHVTKVLASLPQDYRIRKLMILPQTYKNTTALDDTVQYDETLIHKLHVHDRIQFLRTSRDMGPFLKTWAISDPATAARLGAVRTEASKHIFITLDDDMQQHQDLIQNLVNKVIETSQKSVVAVETRSVARGDGNTQTQFVGRSGVAYPARIWTSAFRGDVRDCFMMAPCMQDDDASISQALMRNEVPIVKLGGSKVWSLPSSVAHAKKNVNLKSPLCEESLAKMPIL